RCEKRPPDYYPGQYATRTKSISPAPGRHLEQPISYQEGPVYKSHPGIIDVEIFLNGNLRLTYADAVDVQNERERAEKTQDPVTHPRGSGRREARQAGRIWVSV